MRFQTRRALKKRIQELEAELKKAQAVRWSIQPAMTSNTTSAGNVTWTMNWGDDDDGPGFAHRPVA